MKHNIMVCVTGPRTCDKLIARGMERSADAEIHVVHCVETGRNFMGTPFEGDAVEYLSLPRRSWQGRSLYSYGRTTWTTRWWNTPKRTE